MSAAETVDLETSDSNDDQATDPKPIPVGRCHLCILIGILSQQACETRRTKVLNVCLAHIISIRSALHGHVRQHFEVL